MKTLVVTRKTVQLSLLRGGTARLIALPSVNLHRVTIADLGATAIIITMLLSLQFVLSPLRVFWGRIAVHPSGALHTGMIETGLRLPVPAFGLIFTIAAGLIFIAIVVLGSISPRAFAQLGHQERNRALVAGAEADVYA